jgi:hypothetical protein
MIEQADVATEWSKGHLAVSPTRHSETGSAHHLTVFIKHRQISASGNHRLAVE